ncbi:MAG TPA: hypothetical protein VGS79_08580 [Puia sp.]|nr:hypothetical protein [Puia sp.]
MERKIAILVVWLFIMSCGNEKGGKSIASSTFLQGYWIPASIHWGGDNAGKDTGDVFRTASFRTLSFDSSGTFTMFASTQRKPKNYDDSLIFEGEPGVEIFKGAWSAHDSVIEVAYKIKYTGFSPVDSSEKHEKISIVSGKDTLLFFNKKLYKKEGKYDTISRARMEAYKHE